MLPRDKSALPTKRPKHGEEIASLLQIAKNLPTKRPKCGEAPVIQNGWLGLFLFENHPWEIVARKSSAGKTAQQNRPQGKSRRENHPGKSFENDNLVSPVRKKEKIAPELGFRKNRPRRSESEKRIALVASRPLRKNLRVAPAVEGAGGLALRVLGLWV